MRQVTRLRSRRKSQARIVVTIDELFVGFTWSGLRLPGLCGLVEGMTYDVARRHGRRRLGRVTSRHISAKTAAPFIGVLGFG